MSPFSPPPSRPGGPMLVVTPETMRMRDTLTALGFFGVHVAFAVLAVLVWLGGGASWGSFWPALLVFAASLLPMAAAAALWRNTRAMHNAAPQSRHATREAGAA